MKYDITYTNCNLLYLTRNGFSTYFKSACCKAIEFRNHSYFLVKSLYFLLLIVVFYEF